MDFDVFKLFHSETIMYFQCIENDLKWIYSYLCVGDKYDIYDSLDGNTLGQIINKLKDIDLSDGKPFISLSDYDFLKQMKEKRNYWCHQAYVDFIYEDNWPNSIDYRKICEKLCKDHDKIKNVCNNVEQVKIKARKVFKK